MKFIILQGDPIDVSLLDWINKFDYRSQSCVYTFIYIFSRRFRSPLYMYNIYNNIEACVDGQRYSTEGQNTITTHNAFSRIWWAAQLQAKNTALLWTLHLSKMITFNYPFFSVKNVSASSPFSMTDIFMMDHEERRSYIHYCTSPSYNSIHEQIYKAHWQWKQTTFPKWSNFILPLLQRECRRSRV